MHKSRMRHLILPFQVALVQVVNCNIGDPYIDPDAVKAIAIASEQAAAAAAAATEAVAAVPTMRVQVSDRAVNSEGSGL